MCERSLKHSLFGLLLLLTLATLGYIGAHYSQPPAAPAPQQRTDAGPQDDEGIPLWVILMMAG